MCINSTTILSKWLSFVNRECPPETGPESSGGGPAPGKKEQQPGESMIDAMPVPQAVLLQTIRAFL